MDWKFTSDRPVYQQIMDTLRGAIVTGQLQPDQWIPSTRDLAAQAKVNPNTMQRALTELEREGLLIGCGTSGRKVTTEDAILSSMKEQMVHSLVQECALKFQILGVTPAEAAELLRRLEL